MHELDLEVIVVPVSDLDRAKDFYADGLGFVVDHDTTIDGMGRIVQLTPPGSGCSIVIGSGVVPQMAPGSVKGLQLVVNIAQAHDELVARGVDVSEVQTMGVNPGPHRTRWTTWGSSSTTRTATAGRCNRSPHGRERSGRLGRRFPGHRPTHQLHCGQPINPANSHAACCWGIACEPNDATSAAGHRSAWPTPDRGGGLAGSHGRHRSGRSGDEHHQQAGAARGGQIHAGQQYQARISTMPPPIPSSPASRPATTPTASSSHHGPLPEAASPWDAGWTSR